VQGVRFESSRSSVPVTAPSIATILTGTYPPFHGVRDNKVSILGSPLQTLAEDFQQNGFSTAAVISSFILDARSGFQQGFSHYDDTLGSFQIYSPLFSPLKTDLDGTQRRADEVTRLATSWLQTHRRDRFFLFLHYFDPHDIYDPPPPYDQAFQRNPYYGEVAFTDEQLGVLFKKLHDLKLDRNTLVVFTADHGEALGEHHESSHGFFIYDSTLKVPLIFSCPGFVPQGQTAKGLARGVDIRPTILELMGIPAKGPVQGKSLAATVVRGQPTGIDESYCETYHTRLSYGWSELVGLETAKWKYVRAPKSELYDLQADPGETQNLYGTRRKMVDELSKSLSRSLASIVAGGNAASTSASGLSALDQNTREKLRALGYIEESQPAPVSSSGSSLPDPKGIIVVWARKQEARRHNRAATVMIEAGDSQRAFDELKKALQYDPYDAGAHYNLGQCYIKSGRPEEAISEFRKAIAFDPTMAKARTNLGAALYHRGDRQEAMELWKRSIEIDPGYELAYRDLGSAYLGLKNYSAAATIFRRLVEKNPGSHFGHYGLGVVYFRSGDMTKARAELETSLRLAPPESRDAQEARRVLERLPG